MFEKRTYEYKGRVRVTAQNARSARILGLGEVRFSVCYLIPFPAIIPNACDDYNGRPRVLITSGADQQVLDEARLAVTGWCAQVS
eukprot:COSAG05_NODE_2086_length_3594_cov_18.310730_7_plen_85_part_00